MANRPASPGCALDDVIDPAETRPMISSTLAAATAGPSILPAATNAAAGSSERGHRFVDSW